MVRGFGGGGTLLYRMPAAAMGNTTQRETGSWVVISNGSDG
jgi:hypothetical protein